MAKRKPAPRPDAFEWDRAAVLALAKETCTLCAGLGMRKREQQPCNCVLRSIFRKCYERFRQCQVKHMHVPTVNMQLIASSKSRSFAWGRKDEEYSADFYLVSRRTLDEKEWKIFAAHYLLGEDWSACCRRLNMDRGNFFHSIYRIQQKLGRVFRELKPYALYPLDEYFSGAYRTAEPTAGSLPVGGRCVGLYRLTVPLAA